MDKRTKLQSIVKVSIFALILGFCITSQAEIIYVDDSATGANDGSSWTNAYCYLQDALLGASLGDEIRVAHGVYRPDLGGDYTPGERDATFQLKNGVTIKGGYAGLDIPDKADERAFNIFESTLSGNLNEESDPNNWSSLDCSKVVVTGSNTDETAVIDGFCIINNTNSNASSGAFMVIGSGSPLISNCKFMLAGQIDDYESYIYINNSNPAITKCTFEMYSTSNSYFEVSAYQPYDDSTTVMINEDSNTVLEECIFNNNEKCIINEHSNVILNNCVFQNNSDNIIDQIEGSLVTQNCSFIANPMYIESSKPIINTTCCIRNYSGDLTVKDCMFRDNSLYVNVKSDVLARNTSCCISNKTTNSSKRRNAKISNCDFINNSINLIGCIINESGIIIENCRFIDNFTDKGSILSVSESDIINCIFEANTSNTGSIVSAIPNISNCTFYGNICSNSIINNIINPYSLNIPYSLNVNNCIIKNNSSNAIEGNNINVTYCNIEGGFAGEGNIDIDPDFVEPGYWADINNYDTVVEQDDPNAIWIMGDYHLKSQAGRWDSETQTWVKDDVSSLCIDAGNINTPIGLEPFPNGGASNLGAYGRSEHASKTYFDGNNCDVILSGDINGDSIVDYDDLNIIISQWLLEGNNFINQLPQVAFLTPLDGDETTNSSTVRLEVNANDIDGEVVNVSFSLEGIKGNQMMGKSFSAQKEGNIWIGEFDTGTGYSSWKISAIATDNEGAAAQATITIKII